jgi:ATP-dependent RNA helicase DHX37/DHR1
LLADDWDSRVTPLGYAISAFPVAPRFGKMLALSHQQGMLPYTVCMVAALSVQEVLLEIPIPGRNRKSKTNTNTVESDKKKVGWSWEFIAFRYL